MSIFFAAILIVLFVHCVHAQRQAPTLDDSVRGAITPERAWWDLNFYNLDIRIKPETKYSDHERRYQVRYFEYYCATPVIASSIISVISQ
jgi:hypothetical protein